MENEPNPQGDKNVSSESPYWQMIDQLANAHAASREAASAAATKSNAPRRRKRVLPYAMAASMLASGGAGFGLAQLFISSPATATTSHISTKPTNTGSAGSGSIGGLGNGFSSGNVGGGYAGTGSGNTGGNSGSQNSASDASGGPSNASAIATKVDAGLVDINTNLSFEDEEAAGTGQVLTSDGEILTNNHVIEGATSISVTDIGNGKTYQAKVVGYDTSQDVAVLQLTGASGLSTVSLGNSSSVKSGDAVVGIGNAGGVGGTPSYAGGEITGVNQSITASDSGSGTTENLAGLHATNADIEAGDSGGPLVNSNGDVIGMDTAGSSSEGGFGFTSGGESSATQGFAIPINTAIAIAKKIESGTTTSLIHIGVTAFLGVQIQASNESSNGFGFGGSVGGYGNNSNTSTSGALIAEAISGEPAANAGLATGDTITAVNGTTVTDPASLEQILLALKPNTTVSVTYTDSNGNQATASVKLASGPPQ